MHVSYRLKHGTYSTCGPIPRPTLLELPLWPTEHESFDASTPSLLPPLPTRVRLPPRPPPASAVGEPVVAPFRCPSPRPVHPPTTGGPSVAQTNERRFRGRSRPALRSPPPLHPLLPLLPLHHFPPVGSVGRFGRPTPLFASRPTIPVFATPGVSSHQRQYRQGSCCQSSTTTTTTTN